jgi:hypothetical protein
MPFYHRALDPYHCVLRILRTLYFAPDQPQEFEFVRIAEFCLAFPQIVVSIRLPGGLKARARRLGAEENPYKYSGSSRKIFRQMEPIHSTARNLLLSKGMLSAEEFEARRLLLIQGVVPPSLKELTVELEEEEAEILSLLFELKNAYGLRGQGGLKDRTGLMEFRYDPF